MTLESDLHEGLGRRVEDAEIRIEEELVVARRAASARRRPSAHDEESRLGVGLAVVVRHGEERGVLTRLVA
jgi:hypothetical protein